MQKKCILAIDDTAMQLHSIINILQPMYTVRIAKNGKTGLDFAQKYDIDLILLDMVMPDMPGLEVLNTLMTSEKTKHIPVILATGSTSDEDKQEGLSMGAADCIKKPFEKANVLETVEKVFLSTLYRNGKEYR